MSVHASADGITVAKHSPRLGARRHARRVADALLLSAPLAAHAAQAAASAYTHRGLVRAETRVVLLKVRAARPSRLSLSHTGTASSPNISWPMQISVAMIGRLKRTWKFEIV